MIDGTWFEFLHHNSAEGRYYNDALRGFSAAQWEDKLAEIARFGMRYIVLMNVALNGRTFYPSALLPQEQQACADPVDTLLSAAGRLGLKVFIGCGFWGDWRKPGKTIRDKATLSLGLRGLEELARLYGRYPSFYGWYLPDETGIFGHFSNRFIDYVNLYAAEIAGLTPGKSVLIAPYGTSLAKTDAKFIRQLERLNVDYIAYQDEVGVKKTGPAGSARHFEKLRRAHNLAGRSALWADVELFTFEGMVYKSALLPAGIERIQAQLDAVAPCADTVLCYQYPGLINEPGTAAFAGHPDSVRLHEQLRGLMR